MPAPKEWLDRHEVQIKARDRPIKAIRELIR